ncbi:hypothetical protein BH09SUM1_BH09SUM1_11070 [soil metagenome]
MKKIFRFKRTKSGSALILVLVSMLIMSLIILYALGSAREDTHATYRQVRMVQARYLAEGAVERAKGDILSQIAATNFLGGSFATVGQLYANINTRFSVASKRVPDSMTSSVFNSQSHTASMEARARWEFTGDAASGMAADSSLDIPGVNDWGIGTTGNPLGDVRCYITRSFIDNTGSAVLGTVGSYSSTLTGWAEAGGAQPKAAAMVSKSYFHALKFPPLFEYLLLGNSISDCSMCHLKMRGSVGQINPEDPMEMHLAYNATRFNRLILEGSIYTNGNWTRRAAGESPDDNKQEKMLWTPGQNGMLIWSANGSQLAQQWSTENGGATAGNPFRSISTLADPLPTTWPSVKNNIMQWFEPRATAGISTGASEIKNTFASDNNIGHINTTNFFEGHPFQPFIPDIAMDGSVSPSVPAAPAEATWGTKYYPFTAASAYTGTAPRILYGVRDVNGDGVAETDLNGDGVAAGPADIALAAYYHAIDRAPNLQFDNATLATRANVTNATPGALLFNRGLHPCDDFDNDTIPNAFDPDFDGDGILETLRAGTDPTQADYYVTNVAYAPNITLIAVSPGVTRPQWTLGYQAIRLADTTAPYAARPEVYYVRTGSLLFQAMAGSTTSPGMATRANNGNDTAVTAWPPGTALTIATVTTSATQWPYIVGVEPSVPPHWSSAAIGYGYYAQNATAIAANRMSNIYAVIDLTATAINRTYKWNAEIAGIGAGTANLTAMQALISNEFATTPGQALGVVRGVFPNATTAAGGNPVYPATPGMRSLIIRGSKVNPLAITGQVIVRGDVVIGGYLKGKGQLVTHRNVFIPGDLRYVNPPDWTSTTDKSGDQFGLVSSGNILVGNILHSTTGNNDLMEFVWGNMVDINSASTTGSTWNWGIDGTDQPSKNHMINPVYLFDGAEAGSWVNGEWKNENLGNLVNTVFNSQGMRLGGGLDITGPYFNGNRKHTNFGGDSNPNTDKDSRSFYKNFYISTPGLLPLGADRIPTMPTTFFGTYTNGWFTNNDFKFFTVNQLAGNPAIAQPPGLAVNMRKGYSNGLGSESLETNTPNNNWIRVVEGVLYADFGVIGGNIATSGPNFLEFRGGVIGRDIQIMTVVQNNANDHGTLSVSQSLGTNLVGGLYYDFRLKGAINPLAFPFKEEFVGGEMAQNYMPDLVTGSRDKWTPFRLTQEYKDLISQPWNN